MKAEIRSAILCDGIRQEIGGKKTIVGAYGPYLNIEHFPATIAVQMLLVVQIPAGPFTLNLKIFGPNEEEIAAGRFEGDASAPTTCDLLELPLTRVSLPEESQLRLDASWNDGPWHTAQTWKVGGGAPIGDV